MKEQIQEFKDKWVDYGRKEYCTVCDYALHSCQCELKDLNTFKSLLLDKHRDNNTDHYADQEWDNRRILAAMDDYAEYYHLHQLEKITEEVYQAKVNSLNSTRTGEYRLGLSRAIDIIQTKR